MSDSHKLSIILCKLNYIVMIMPVAFRNGQDHIALIGRYRSMWRRCMNHHVPAATRLTAASHCGREALRLEYCCCISIRSGESSMVELWSSGPVIA